MIRESRTHHILKYSSGVFYFLGECSNKGNAWQLTVNYCLCLKIQVRIPWGGIALSCRGVMSKFARENYKISIRNYVANGEKKNKLKMNVEDNEKLYWYKNCVQDYVSHLCSAVNLTKIESQQEDGKIGLWPCLWGIF